MQLFTNQEKKIDMNNKFTQNHSPVANTPLANSQRGWLEYFKESVFNIYTYLRQFIFGALSYLRGWMIGLPSKVVGFFTLFLSEALNTPFGVCVFLLCATYRYYPTQDTTLFASQSIAGYYVIFLFLCSLLSPLLMWSPSARGFLYSQVGEQLVQERLGKRGFRPLIHFLSATTFLYFINLPTKAPIAPVDFDQWNEVYTHCQKAQSQNNAVFYAEIAKINQEQLALPEEKQSDPETKRELSEKRMDALRQYVKANKRVSADTQEMAHLAISPKGEREGAVSEFSDRIKDFFRGKDRNRALWVVGRGSSGSIGFTQYDQSQDISHLHGKVDENSKDMGLLKDAKK